MSSLYAVVLRWSGSRKHYEQQGLFVQREALEKAEAEYLNNKDTRQRRRLREAKIRSRLIRIILINLPSVYVTLPKCPAGNAKEIAEHACQNYSGTVGRAAGKDR